jgi:hypothetical protein
MGTTWEQSQKSPARSPQFVSGVAGGDPHRRATCAASDTEHPECVAVQRALRHADAPARQQFTGLHRRQPILDEPGLQLIVIGLDDIPGGAVTVGTVRAHPFAHLADQLVAQLLLSLFAATPPQATAAST